MIRRILMLLLLVQAGAVLALAGIAARYAHLAPPPAIIGGAALLLLVRLAITANNFGLSWRARSPTPAAYQLATAARLCLFLREFRASMVTSSWTMLRPVGLQLQATPRGVAVLLIHGYGCNGGYWRPLSARLRAAGISHYAIDLEPPTAGRRLRPSGASCQRVAARGQRCRSHRDCRPQHGRPGGARLAAAPRRRPAGALDHARHTAPRHRAGAAGHRPQRPSDAPRRRLAAGLVGGRTGSAARRHQLAFFASWQQRRGTGIMPFAGRAERRIRRHRACRAGTRRSCPGRGDGGN